MRLIFGSVLIALLTGCAASMTNYYTQTVQSWRGGNINTLYKHWGRPDARYSGTNGSVVYVYNTANSARASSTLNANGMNRGPQSHACNSAFTVNRSGVIIDTRIIGSHCYASESFANRMRNPK